MSNPLKTIYYFDGTPTETREMTDAEVLEAFPDGLDPADEAPAAAADPAE
jgi:hypothetical protein